MCVHGQSAEEGALGLLHNRPFTPRAAAAEDGAAAAQLTACGAHNIPAAVAGGSIVRVALMPAPAGDRDGRAKALDALVGPG